MRRILFGIVSFIISLVFSYKKGSSNQKQATENEQYKATIEAVKSKKKSDDIINSIPDDELRKL